MSTETTSDSAVDLLNILIAIIGLLLGFYFGNKNATKDRWVHIADKRQDWINTLRDAVSGFLKCFRMIAQEKDKEHNHIADLHLFKHKIKLMLNPDEKRTKRLLEAMDAMIDLFDYEYKDSEMKELADEVEAAAGKIFEVEWKRVKIELGGKKYKKD